MACLKGNRITLAGVILMCTAMVMGQEPDYQKTLQETDCFTGFFAAEKAAIKPEKRDTYKKWISGYFERLDGNTTLHHPGAQLKGLITGIRKGDFLVSKQHEKAFEDAAWLAGMELIRDRRCFEPNLKNVEVIEGVTYATRDGYPLKCDIYLPNEKADRRPVILCIHGGGFRVHRRAWFGGHGGYFANRGYAAVAIDYRKEPGIRSELEPIQDAKAAVRWIRQDAAKYGWDPERIGAVGGSAGALLTALLATTGGEVQLEGPEAGAAPLTFSSKIHAAVGFATGVRNIKREDVPKHELEKFPPELDLRLMSPYWSADKNSAPIFLIHGTNDKVINVQNAKDLHAKYQENGVQSKIHLVRGEGHVFYTKEKWAATAFEFFESVFK